jgi:hypothetical protein
MNKYGCVNNVTYSVNSVIINMLYTTTFVIIL